MSHLHKFAKYASTQLCSATIASRRARERERVAIFGAPKKKKRRRKKIKEEKRAGELAREKRE